MAPEHPRSSRGCRTTRARTLLGAVTAGLLATAGLAVSGQTSQAATVRQAEALDRAESRSAAADGLRGPQALRLQLPGLLGR